MSPVTTPRTLVYPRGATRHNRSTQVSEQSRQPNALQLARLASLAGVPLTDVEGKSIATLKSELPLDPELFDFELVCGQVVKVDPVTGLKYPVAGATVSAYDLVCNWLWFFPPGWPYSWGFRLPNCVEELIGSVVTDDCGNFCIVIPRWDIVWIREWITQRWCFPEILRRPTVADLLLPKLPGSGSATGTSATPPDPATLADLLATRTDLATAIGPAAVRAIRDAAERHVVGAPTTGLSQVLAAPAFSRPVPAPVPAELAALPPAEALRSLSSRLRLPSSEGELDLAAPYGPFPRCIDIEVPIWVPFFSVPDISFQVTQEIGGTTQVIYDGAFEAGWASHPPFAYIELDVAQFAVASPFPGCQPEGIVCEDEPAIAQIGFLDVNPDYLDPGTGFAVRVNKDSNGDVPSTAPFQADYGYLALFGCAPDAQFYRIMASHADSNGLVYDAGGSVVPLPASAFGPAQPVVGTAWQVSQLGTGTLSPQIVPDADGWYSTEYLSWLPENLLVNWNPGNGVYRLTVQTGNGTPGSVTQTGSSGTPVVVVVDNTPPTVSLTPVSWNYPGGAPVPFTSDDGCYTIDRTAADIEVNLAYTVAASHLYSVTLGPDGCDTSGVTVANNGGLGANPPGSNDLGYVYDGPADNSIAGTVTYTISADAPYGCYAWTLAGYSRAFSPDDAAGLTDNAGFAWNYTQAWVWSDTTAYISVRTTG